MLTKFHMENKRSVCINPKCLEENHQPSCYKGGKIT